MRRFQIPELILQTIAQLRQAPYPLSHPEAVIWRDHIGRLCAYGYSQEGEHWLHFPNLASFRFSRLNAPVTAYITPLVPPTVIRDTFFRNVLPMVLQLEGIEVLHASAVFHSQGVVALCAPSGTGKSTLAYGLQRRGWPLWADDAVAFELDGPVVRTISLPCEIRLNSEVRSFFGRLPSPLQSNADSPGGNHNFLTKPRQAVPLAAIMKLERVQELENQQRIEILRLSPSKAFPLLLSQAYCFSLNDIQEKRRMMVNYARLCANIPVFEIRYTSGLKNLAFTVEGIEKIICHEAGT